MVEGFVREQDRPLLDDWQPASILQPATYNSLVKVAEQHCNEKSCGRLQETDSVPEVPPCSLPASSGPHSCS